MKTSCLPCRVRHSKCDGEAPCAQCRLRKTDCQFSRSENKQKIYMWSEPDKRPSKIAKHTETHKPEVTHMFHRFEPEETPKKSSKRVEKESRTEAELPAALSPKMSPHPYEKLSMEQLLQLVANQNRELQEMEAQQRLLPHKHVQKDGDWTDIKGSDFGESDSSTEFSKTLVDCYVKRNAFFYPDGTVPVDYPGAELSLVKVSSKARFQQLLASQEMQELVDAFCYCIVFGYGAKSLYLWRLGQEFSLRADALLEVMLRADLVSQSRHVCKILSLIGFHTIFLIGFGFEDVVRYIFGIEHYLFMPNASHVSATLAALLYGNVAAITTDIPQRRVWLRKLEALNPNAIPPYYDAYRMVWLTIEILLQPSGIYDVETLIRPLTELEVGWRQHLVEQGNTSIAKMATFPPYAFTHVDNVARSIKAILYGTKALNLMFLGKRDEALLCAQEAIQTLQDDDIPFFTTILMYALTGTIQVALVLRNRDLYLDGMIKLAAIRPEIPRTGAHLQKLHEQAVYFGIDVENIKIPRVEELKALESQPFEHLNELSLYGPAVPVHSVSGPNLIIPPQTSQPQNSASSSPTTSTNSLTPSLAWPSWNYLPEIDLNETRPENGGLDGLSTSSLSFPFSDIGHNPSSLGDNSSSLGHNPLMSFPYGFTGRALNGGTALTPNPYVFQSGTTAPGLLQLGLTSPQMLQQQALQQRQAAFQQQQMQQQIQGTLQQQHLQRQYQNALPLFHASHLPSHLR